MYDEAAFAQVKTAMSKQQRDRRAMPILILIGVMAAGYYASTVGPSQSKAAEAFDRHMNTISRYKSKALAEVERNGTVSDATGREALDTLVNEAAAAPKGDVQSVLRAETRWIRDMQQEMNEVDRTKQLAVDAHYNQPGSLNTEQDLRSALDAVKTYEARCKRTEAFVRATPGAMRQYLLDEGATNRAVAAYLGGLSRTVPRMLAIREADTTAVGAVREQLELLQREWGHWKVSGERRIAFEHDAAIDQFNALCEKIDAANKKRTQLAKDMLSSPTH